MQEAQQVLDFWFSDATKAKWWVKETDFDDEVRNRFGDLHRQAAAGALAAWETSPEGALALVLLLDQAPRNIFRGTPQAFASDALARAAARRAVEAGLDMRLPAERRMFFYMPFEHSEDLADQRRAVALMTERVGDPEAVKFAEAHLRIVERFGRFPHRNQILGRTSTPEEEAFLKQPGSSF